MGEWTVVVDDLFARTSYANSPLNAESIKKTIHDRTTPTKVANRHPVFKNFKRIHSGLCPAFGNAVMHCEIVLASLPKYSPEILGEIDGEVMGLFQVMSRLVTSI
jgi:hypothetical protein